MVSFWHRDRPLVILLGVALGLRLIYLLQAVHTPLYEVLLIDSEFYDRYARQIASGGGMGDRVFFMNPFYPYFLGIIYALFGVKWWLVGGVQALMGTANCGLIFWLGRKVESRLVGLVAAGLAAVYGVLVFYDGALLTATPILFFNLLSLVALLQWRGTGRRCWLLGGGVCLGLSATGRPSVLLFVALLCLWFVRGERGWKTGLCSWLVLLLGSGGILGVVGMRNFLVGGEFVLTTSAAGMNFYVGNHPGATGIYAQVDFLSSPEPEKEKGAFLQEARRRSGQYLTPGEASRFWLQEGLAFIVAEPGRYLRLLGRKCYMFWNRVESQNNLSYYFARDFSPLLWFCPIGWGAIIPLALASWFLECRRGRCLLFDLYAGAYLVGCLLFFVSSEYRLPVVPVAVIYAARGIVWGKRRMRERAYRSLAGGVALVGLLAIPVNYTDAFAAQLTTRRVDYYNFGVLYERGQNYEKAERMFRQSLKIDPGFERPHRGLARIYLDQGHLQEAMKSREAVERLGGRLEEEQERLLLGLHYFTQGEYERALGEWEILVERGTDRPQLFNNLGLCYYKLGRMTEAKERLRRALELAPGYTRALYNLGLVFIAGERPSQAEKAFLQVLGWDERNTKARFKLGEVYARLGRREEAADQWDYLLQIYPDDAQLRTKIDSLKHSRLD